MGRLGAQGAQGPTDGLTMGRTYYVSRDIRAGCFSCWGSDCHWTGKNAQAVAARHHDATGHETWADVYMSITYGEREKRRA